jgi:hypothetical protein
LPEEEEASLGCLNMLFGVPAFFARCIIPTFSKIKNEEQILFKYLSYYQLKILKLIYAHSK